MGILSKLGKWKFLGRKEAYKEKIKTELDLERENKIQEIMERIQKTIDEHPYSVHFLAPLDESVEEEVCKRCEKIGWGINFSFSPSGRKIGGYLHRINNNMAF